MPLFEIEYSDDTMGYSDVLRENSTAWFNFPYMSVTILKVTTNSFKYKLIDNNVGVSVSICMLKADASSNVLLRR
jgi:hypothetical protein